jgi:cytochrome d ubiquinol oxidase subunit I
MHYPWWYVPYLTAPMLIAAIAVVHVLVAHYAVGGGLFLAVETGYAYRHRDGQYLAYLKKHARFFILLTVVLGAITGVGIWWTIGLSSPLATELLIRTFVFGWAMEWVFFVIEITAAMVFYYYWGRLTERTHLVIGWIYALAAWISLVLITAITAFMLNPGQWQQGGSFWAALLNPQFIPQTVARTGGALLLSSLYVYLHASLVVQDNRLRDRIGSRSARPAMLGAISVTAGGIGWYLFMPPAAKVVLESAAVLNVLVALIFALTVAVFVLLYLGPYRNPGWLSPGFAGALFLFGLAAFSTGEFIREAVRKPYIIYGSVLGNQILPDEVVAARQQGFLEYGTWTRAWTTAFVAQKDPRVIVRDPAADQPAHPRIDERRLPSLPYQDRVALGEVLFQYHCNDCHAAAEGYSAVGPLLQGRSREMILSLVENLHKAHLFMPPWSGTPEEAGLLADYLDQMPRPLAGGMFPGLPGPEGK